MEIYDITKWRHRLVGIMNRTGAIVAPVGVLAALPVHLERGHYGMIAFGAGLWIYFLVSSLVKIKSHSIRASMLLGGIYIATIVFLYHLGPEHARPVWLFMCALGATFIFGLRAAFWAPLLSAYILFVVYLLRWNMSPQWAGEQIGDLTLWGMFIVNFLILTYIACLSVGYIILSLERALMKERLTKQRIIEEDQKLKEAVYALQNEIEERKKLEAQLEQSQKLEAIGRVTGSMAHDLNNILMPITAFADLAKYSLSTDQKEYEYMDHILNAARQARDLVGQVLNFSRQVTPADEVVSVSQIMEEVTQELQAGLSDRVKIIKEFMDESLLIFANKNAVHRVFMNIAKNAVDALNENDPTISFRTRVISSKELTDSYKVPLDSGSAEKFVEIEIADNGSGMDEKTAESIFEPFFTTKPYGKGTGLGLASAVRIVRAMSGHIRFKTELGKGTSFFITFPESSQVTEVVSQQLFKDGKSRRVFLVDDNEYSLLAIQQQLEQLGHQVRTATSSLEALEYIEQDPSACDCMITDWKMPKMNGVELVQEVRKKSPDLPVLIVTGHAEERILDDIDQLGKIRLLMKPFESDELEDAIYKVCEK
jgi:signal transduction histidine kinase/CheY-like chemotaxis protein